MTTNAPLEHIGQNRAENAGPKMKELMFRLENAGLEIAESMENDYERLNKNNVKIIIHNEDLSTVSTIQYNEKFECPAFCIPACSIFLVLYFPAPIFGPSNSGLTFPASPIILTA